MQEAILDHRNLTVEEGAVSDLDLADGRVREQAAPFGRPDEPAAGAPPSPPAGP